MEYATDCSIIMQPMWQSLEPDPAKIKQFGGKWILVGSVIFKKGSEAKVSMRELHLQWSGPFLDNLNATLYKENSEKQFLPLQENVICDGQWNKKKQIIVLRFDHAEPLSVVNVFYLVLTLPQEIEHNIKHGSFTITQSGLPDPFKDAVKLNNTLVLASK